MTRKVYAIFSLIILFLWSSNWWAYKLFKWADGQIYAERKSIMLMGVGLILISFLVHLVLYARKPHRDFYTFDTIVLNLIMFLTTAVYAMFMSILEEGQYKWDFLVNSSRLCKVQDSLTILLGASGYEIIMVFLLVLLSGYFYDKKKLKVMLIGWLVVLFIHEIVIQYFLSYRSVNLMDYVNNVVGGLLSAMLIKWME